MEVVHNFLRHRKEECVKNVSSLARSSKRAASVIPFRRNARPASVVIGKLLLQAFLQTARRNTHVFSPHYGYSGYDPTNTNLRSGGETLRILSRALDLRAQQRSHARSNGKMPADSATPWNAELWSRKRAAGEREEILKCLEPLRLGKILETKLVKAIMGYEK